MVSILPGPRTAWGAIGQQLGQNLNQVMPGVIQQNLQRERGYQAIDRLQNDLASANGDISKILPAIARAYTDNPNLERSGIAQYALQNAKAANIYGNPQPGQPQAQTTTGQPQPTGPQAQPGITGQPQPSPEIPRQTNYNIKTPVEMDTKAKQDALATGNPAQYQQSLNEQNALNDIAKTHRASLEDLAKREGVGDTDLPDFMEVGEQFASQNPDQWLKNTRAAYAPIKSNFDKLNRQFIPGIGSALLGRNRDEALKKITPSVQDLVKLGRENQVRTFLQNNFLSPTEVEEQIHPIQKKQEAALSRLPNGIFPAQKAERSKTVSEATQKHIERKTHPFVDYETAVRNAPKEMQTMKNQLADFFLKNVDDNTSLLPLANKIWEDKSYDWRQIGPAIRQAQEKGLVLNPRQQAEMGDIDSQPPIQSLPDIFQDWWRAVQFFKGAK
jgi:hypothetical protein